MGAVETLRDALYGSPPSPSFEPSREGVLAAFTEIYAQVQAAVAGMTAYATKALLLASPPPAAGTQARVYADATAAFNGVYVYKSGAWTIDVDFYSSLQILVQPKVDIATAAAAAASASNSTATTQAGIATAAATTSVNASADAANRALASVRNIYDKARAGADGTGVRVSDGAIVAVGGYFASGPIRVSQGTQITFNRLIYAGGGGGTGYVWRDANGAIVAGGTTAGVAANTPLTVPTGAAFFEGTFALAANGKSALYAVNGSSIPAKFRNFDLVDTFAVREQVADRNADLFQRTVNLFDKTRITTGQYLNTASGTLTAGAGFFTTDFMSVIGGRSYVTNKDQPSGTGYVWFTEDKAYLSGANTFVAGTPIVAPANAAYLRMTFNVSVGGNKLPDAPTAMVVEGTSVPTPYRAAGYMDDEGAARRAATVARSYQPAILNLFDPRRIIAGPYLNNAGDAVGAVGGTVYFYSDIMPVRPGVPIYLTLEFNAGGIGVNWYDRDGVRIGSTAGPVSANTAIVPPEGAMGVRISHNQATISLLKVTEGAAVTAGALVYGWDDIQQAKPWLGVKTATGGDSIMQASNTGGGIINANNGSYQNRLAHLTGWNNMLPGGVAGRLTRQILDGTGSGASPVHTSPLIAADVADVELFYAHVGTNDFQASPRAIGALGDTAASNTYYGDLYDVYINKLMTWKPTIQLAVTTMFPRFDSAAGISTPDTVYGNPTNSLGNKLSDYVNALQVFCAAYGIPCLDLFRSSGITAQNKSVFMPDNLHPSLGYTVDRFAPRVAKWLGTLR